MTHSQRRAQERANKRLLRNAKRRQERGHGTVPLMFNEWLRWMKTPPESYDAWQGTTVKIRETPPTAEEFEAACESIKNSCGRC